MALDVPRPNLHIAGGFSRDAILHADGSYETDRLGGNALWSAMGARLAGTPSFVHTVLGADYPTDVLAELALLDIDTTATRIAADRMGVRVTYVYEADGTRLQPAPAAALLSIPEPHRSQFIDTTRRASETLGSLPTVDDLPENNLGNAWHLGLLPVTRFHELVDHLGTDASYLQADCPARFELRRDGIDALAGSLERLDVFLPSTSDTSVFSPGLSRSDVVRAFHDLGANVVVLKCAEDGAVVSERHGNAWHIPIFDEADLVDATGAGDVFAGAFAAAMCQDSELVHAASMGAAAASFAIAYRSPLELQVSPREVASRALNIEQRVTKL